MKNRSHRLPASSADQKDDWVEESWTVDCVCGVNFDDGEEMVNCDECAVWVHTRCSRYVKTDKSFVCDKCKNNNNHNSNHHLLRNNNDDSSEETEVAQLLVELPTKTLRRMDSNPLPPPPPTSYKSSALPASRRPFRLWTDNPIDERVHVQGIPGAGADPALFSDISAVFGPQLWKCTGYIPKKFNFRYKEFPCWDKEEEAPEKEDSDQKIERQTDSSADNGKGVLFSLAKLDVPQQDAPAARPVVVSVGAEKQSEDGKGSYRFVSSKETGKLESLNLDYSILQNEVGKDRILPKPPFLHFEKRKREDLLNSKDRSGKKKARILEKDGECKKKIRLHTPDRGPMAVEVDPECGKGENSSYPLPTSHLSLDPVVVDHAVDAQKSNSKENGRRQVPLKLEESSKAIIGVSSLLQSNTSGSLSAKEEVTGVSIFTPNVLEGELTNGGTGMQQSEQGHEDLASAGPRTEDDRSAPDSSINAVTSHPEIHAKSKTELPNGARNINVKLSSLYDAKLSSSGTLFQSQDSAAYCTSEHVSVNDTNITGLAACNSKAEDVVRRSEAVDLHKQRVDGESPLDHCEPKHNSTGLDGFSESKKFSSGFGSNVALESNKSNVTVSSPKVATGEGRVSVSVTSSFPSSSVIPMPKSFASDNCNIGTTGDDNNVDSQQKWVQESSLTGSITEVVEDEVRPEKARKLMKEHSKSTLSSVPKSSQLKKFSHAAIVSKRTSDLKDSMPDSPSSPTLVPPIASHPSSELVNVQRIETSLNIQKTVSSSQFDSASNVPKKVTGSLLSHKGEKTNQLSQPSSKVNSTLTHAAASSNSPSTLSDEELALLLHQELNSSPRVPRVPRMRHAGSLPQLTSPTATSMLMKRTSSTGGKDHVLAFRRKTKDLAKDGSHGFGEMDDEAKKMDRVSSSIDHRRQDSAFISDAVSKREADSGSANGLYSIKKSNAPSRRAASSSLSSPAEGNECNFSATRLSPRIPSDDEKGVGGRLTHRTLPGLLAEIMSEGKRMTYEELCNSVLPHWPYLRKHNGERYAYSSHSQAVLDCLRNRNEWARLVDRGPKTSGGRKRRKSDSGNAGVESEDNDDGRDGTGKDGSRSKTLETHHEEFPKGKRKARKRRRLALQGRGIKDVRRRRKADEVSDEEEEDGSFSDSSEETMFSEEEEEEEEEEIQGSGMSGAGNDVSANSDGTENI